MDNSSNNNFRSSIEDISNIDDVALDFSVPINQNSKKLNSFEKLKMYLNNVSLQSERRYNAVYFKSNIVKFSKYLIKKNSKRRYLYTALLAMLTAVITVFLVQNSGLYTAGFSGVFQGIARIVQAAMLKANVNEYSVNIIYNLLFWGLYFVANIPLLIFSYLNFISFISDSNSFNSCSEKSRIIKSFSIDFLVGFFETIRALFNSLFRFLSFRLGSLLIGLAEITIGGILGFST